MSVIQNKRDKPIVNSLRQLLFIAVLLSANEMSFAQTCAVITTIAGNGTGSFSGDGGPSTAATINVPQGIAFDTSGNMFFSDYGNRRIRKITSTGVISTIAGTGVMGYTGDGGAATLATIIYPTGLTVDSVGNIYFTDPGCHVIRKITTSGIISTVAGTGFAGFSGDGGPATAAQLNTVAYVAFDNLGNLIIADNLNHRVRKINSAGVISTIAGTGIAGFSGDGGSATLAQLNQPASIVTDAMGNIYVGEAAGNRFRKINSTGTITTFAGTGIAGYSGDGGPATAANCIISNGCIDHLGKFYFADQIDHRVRIINASGIINNFAGTGIAGFSGDGGAATAAKLNGPYLMTVDYAGNFYIADQNNNRIRKIVSSPDSISGSASLCAGSTITLTNVTSGGIWSSSLPGVATVGGSTGVVSGVSSGIATISYTVSTVCGTLVATKIVTINPFPSAGTITGLSIVGIGSNITLSDTATGGTWSATNSNATVSSSGVVTGVTAGIDTIYYIKTNVCGSDTAKMIITILNTVGIDKVTSESVIIYPNPTKDIVNINSTTKIEKVEVFNFVGQKVLTQNPDRNNIILSIKELIPGIYTIRINNHYVRKLVKQ